VQGCADNGEDVRDIYIAKALDAYESFYDKDWAERFSKITKTMKLSEPGLDLIMDWKGAAFTAAMPWVLIRRLDSPYDRWDHYMQSNTFKTTLWSSQRICYAAIYHAYENFLTRCVGEALKKPNYRPRPKKDKRSPTEALGADLNDTIPGAGDHCLLKDERVDFGRRVRNSLAHNGGRSWPGIDVKNAEHKTDDGRVHKLTVWHGKIQVVPEDTRFLLDLLKQKAFWLAEKAKDHPKFRIATA
jgi:hypothetical protein